MELLPVLVTIDSPAWSSVGACAQTDPEVFFPERGDSEAARQARAVCAGCEIAPVCREYAVENHELGVWGGTTERERQAIRRARRATPPPAPAAGDEAA